MINMCFALTDGRPRYPERGCSLQVFHLLTCHILSFVCSWYLASGLSLIGTWHILWSWYILACQWSDISLFPSVHPDSLGLHWIDHADNGTHLVDPAQDHPLLWVCWFTLSFVKNISRGLLFLPQVPWHELKARSLKHRLLFLHLLWKLDAARVNNGASCRQRVTIFT